MLEMRGLPFGHVEIITDWEFQPSEKYYLHTLSLRPSLESLFQNLHKDAYSEKVRRAEREELRL